MNDNTEPEMQPDRMESFGKLIGIVGGLVAVFSGIYQFGQSNLQSARELRWNQAEAAQEMISTMLADEGWIAMEMMDWDDEGRVYDINGQSVRVNAEIVYTALRKEVSDDTDRFIIDRLDRTFFLVSQLEIAVRSELVNMEDVRYPLSWYAAERMCPHKQLFESYMRDYAAPETLSFFERLEEWRSC
ncbi:MAG: hypothetical protein WBJ75_14500 [Pseudohongiellaceae bacterium]